MIDLLMRDSCVKLRCVGFVAQEDLGDGILCTREGQEIWVALSFARNFQEAPIGEAR